MLAPDYLDHAPDRLVLLFQQVEDDILRDVARRISKMDTITPTANWQLWRYEQTEALRQDVVKKLARYTGKSEAEIRRLMQEAATRTMEAEDEIYYHYGKEPTPFADNATLQALLNAGYQQTAGTFHNLTATTANTVSGQFEAALDRAHLKVSSGAFDYKNAVKSAVDSLADTMKYVTYPTGGARPSHAEWQGRQFHRGGAMDYMGKHYPDFEAATGYGTGAGLCGWNCRHTFFAIFPELGAPPAWTQESLEALNARDIEYNGGRYTRYEISQMQRARERTVRKYKRRYLAEDAAGADTTASAVKLRAARQELADFISATGGRADSARTSVAGFGRSQSSRATWATKKFDSMLPNQRGSGGSSGQSGETVHKFLGKVDLKDTQQMEVLKDSFCSSYANSKVENMMVITRNGEVHYMTDNNPRGVDCSYLGGKLKGSYNIHTHPPDTTQYSFSTDTDIPAAFADGTRIMEAVDYKYRYQFAVPREITFEQWETVCEEVREEQNAVMASRGYGFDDYEENIQHVIIDETCRRLGLKCYHREKRK